MSTYHYGTEVRFDGAIVPVKAKSTASPNKSVANLTSITDGTSNTFRGW